MKPKLSILFLALTGLAALHAQTPSDDPFRDILFSPEMIMQNQQALGLTDEQKNFLKTEMTQAQTRFTELQWKLQSEVERLVSMVKESNADERQALAQLDNVLAAEREVKRTQIALLLRIKNHLRPEQQTKLREIQMLHRPQENPHDVQEKMRGK
jgi:Spy/CpxP family protein refolding chaperone